MQSNPAYTLSRPERIDKAKAHSIGKTHIWLAAYLLDACPILGTNTLQNLQLTPFYIYLRRKLIESNSLLC